LGEFADVVFPSGGRGGGKGDAAAEQQFAAAKQGSDVQDLTGVHPADRLCIRHHPLWMDQGVGGCEGGMGEYFAEKH
jgi:hypothetical protein